MDTRSSGLGQWEKGINGVYHAPATMTSPREESEARGARSRWSLYPGGWIDRRPAVAVRLLSGGRNYPGRIVAPPSVMKPCQAHPPTNNTLLDLLPGTKDKSS